MIWPEGHGERDHKSQDYVSRKIEAYEAQMYMKPPNRLLLRQLSINIQNTLILCTFCSGMKIHHPYSMTFLITIRHEGTASSISMSQRY